jgi:chromosome segregation ATPase
MGLSRIDLRRRIPLPTWRSRVEAVERQRQQACARIAELEREIDRARQAMERLQRESQQRIGKARRQGSAMARAEIKQKLRAGASI